MIEEGLKGVEFIAISTDAQALLMSDADVKLDVGRELTRGLGANANPEVGSASGRRQRAGIVPPVMASPLVAHDAAERLWPAPLRVGPPWRGRSCPDTLIGGMGCLEGAS